MTVTYHQLRDAFGGGGVASGRARGIENILGSREAYSNAYEEPHQVVFSALVVLAREYIWLAKIHPAGFLQALSENLDGEPVPVIEALDLLSQQDEAYEDARREEDSEQSERIRQGIESLNKAFAPMEKAIRTNYLTLKEEEVEDDEDDPRVDETWASMVSDAAEGDPGEAEEHLHLLPHRKQPPVVTGPFPTVVSDKPPWLVRRPDRDGFFMKLPGPVNDVASDVIISKMIDFGYGPEDHQVQALMEQGFLLAWENLDVLSEVKSHQYRCHACDENFGMELPFPENAPVHGPDGSEDGCDFGIISRGHIEDGVTWVPELTEVFVMTSTIKGVTKATAFWNRTAAAFAVAAVTEDADFLRMQRFSLSTERTVEEAVESLTKQMGDLPAGVKVWFEGF